MEKLKGKEGDIMKKTYLTIVFSIIALFVSLLVAILWFCQTKNTAVIDSGTYISVSVTVLAIIVAIVLGWHIYNVIDYKEKVTEIEELKKELQRKSKELDLKINDVNCDLLFVNDEIDIITLQQDKFYGLTIVAYMKSLIAKLDKSDISKEMSCIENMLETMTKIARTPFIKDNSVCNVREIIEGRNEIICSHKNYIFIKAIYDDFFLNMKNAQKWV